jgi:hypothetical protein
MLAEDIQDGQREHVIWLLRHGPEFFARAARSEI